MHNGNIGGFDEIRFELMKDLSKKAFDYAVKHSSDSGLCFAIFMDQVGVENMDDKLTPDVFKLKVENTIKKIWEICDDNNITECSLLNFVISDGDVVTACRVVRDPLNPDSKPASMYIAAGTSFSRTPHDEAEFTIKQGFGTNVAIIASEPITDDHTDWLIIPKNHLVVIIKQGMHVLSTTIATPQSSEVKQFCNIGVKQFCKNDLIHTKQLSKCIQSLNWKIPKKSANSIDNSFSDSVSIDTYIYNNFLIIHFRDYD